MKALGRADHKLRGCICFEDQYDNVLPIWGVQREKELDEFLSYIACPPAMTDEIKTIIEKDQKELSGNFAAAAVTVCHVRQALRLTPARA